MATTDYQNLQRAQLGIIGCYSLDQIRSYPAAIVPHDMQVGEDMGSPVGLEVCALGTVRLFRISETLQGSRAVGHLQTLQQALMPQQSRRSDISVSMRVELRGVGFSFVTAHPRKRPTGDIAPAARPNRGIASSPQRGHLRSISVRSNKAEDEKTAAWQRRELLYLSLAGLSFHVTAEPERDDETARESRTVVDLALQSLQLDNQMYNAKFPVVLCPESRRPRATAFPNRPTDDNASLFRLCVILANKRSNAEAQFWVVPLLSVELLPISVQLEEALVTQVILLSSSLFSAMASLAPLPQTQQSSRRGNELQPSPSPLTPRRTLRRQNSDAMLDSQSRQLVLVDRQDSRPQADRKHSRQDSQDGVAVSAPLSCVAGHRYCAPG